LKKILFNKKLIIFIIFFVFPTNLLAVNIATINISYILEKSTSYNNFLAELSKKKSELQNTLDIKEKDLTKLKQEIDNSKLIINEDELNLMIFNYNDQLKTLDKEVKKINLFFSKNIEVNKNIIIKQIISYIEDISIKSDIDIILTEEQYFMSSKKIDISNQIINLLNEDIIVLKIIDE
tara:strand:+ start:2299 stop:2835 length:537 start_codon:yes stop_codon:yes gene_type:complete